MICTNNPYSNAFTTDENDISSAFSPMNSRQARHHQQPNTGGISSTHTMDALLCSLERYKAGAVQAVRKALSERGVALPDGTRSSLMAPFVGTQETAAPAPALILSKVSPINGQGPLTTAFDPNAESQQDIHLVIYLIDPFTQVGFLRTVFMYYKSTASNTKWGFLRFLQLTRDWGPI